MQFRPPDIRRTSQECFDKTAVAGSEPQAKKKRPPTEAALLHPKLRTAVISKAAATPSATAAAVPFSRLGGMTVKPVATIAKPAITAAIWVKVGAIYPS